MKMIYSVTPIMPEAASHLTPNGVSAADNAAVKLEPRTFRATRVRTTRWVPQNLEGARVPAASLQRMANASTQDIRGAVVFDDGVSGSRKWSPPV